VQISAPVQRRRLLTLREAAALLSVSERTVRRLIDERGLPAFRLGPKGTSIRVDELELRAWLAGPEEAA
jgi:excisionase family DNA binding protein